MIYNLAHNGNKLITFTIDGTTYQAIDGMTWGEWCNSDYNAEGFYIYNSYVFFNTGKKCISNNQSSSSLNAAKSTDVILVSHEYYGVYPESN